MAEEICKVGSSHRQIDCMKCLFLSWIHWCGSPFGQRHVSAVYYTFCASRTYERNMQSRSKAAARQFCNIVLSWSLTIHKGLLLREELTTSMASGRRRSSTLAASTTSIKSTTNAKCKLLVLAGDLEGSRADVRCRAQPLSRT